MNLNSGDGLKINKRPQSIHGKKGSIETKDANNPTGSVYAWRINQISSYFTRDKFDITKYLYF